jgi:hypothetical protein
LIAAVIIVVSLYLPSIIRKTSEFLPNERMTLSSLVFTIVALGIALPLSSPPDEFATGRGFLWRLVLEETKKDVVFGLGSGYWQELYKSGAFGAASAYSTHNQWVETYLLAGIVGVILLFVAVLSWSNLKSPSSRTVLVPIVVTFLTLGLVERPIPIAEVSGSTFALLSLIASESFYKFRSGRYADDALSR